MAQAFKATIVGVNGKLNTASAEYVFPTTAGIRVITETYGVAGALCTIIVPASQVGGGFTNFQSSQSLDTVLANINGATTSEGSAIFSQGILIEHTNTAAVNATATISAAELAKGYVTSTSAAATTITLPTATLLGTQLGASKGTVFTFYVDNTAGANTVTVAVGVGIVTQSVLTGGETLTIANSATEGIGTFQIVFSSATAAVLSRIA
jgi:hypothetical protein